MKRFAPEPRTERIDTVVVGNDEGLTVRSVNVVLGPNDVYRTERGNGEAFVTTALLDPGITYQSGWLDASNYTQVQTAIVASHDGTLLFEFATSPPDIVRTLSIPYLASEGYRLFAAPVFAPFIQYSFTNTSASTQTDFYYATQFLTQALSPQLLAVDAFVSPSMVANLQRSVLVGKTTAGVYTNVTSALDGSLKISDGAKGIYGESVIINYTPYVQTSHMYGNALDSQLHNFFANLGSAAASSDGSSIDITIGTDLEAFAIVRDTRVIKYRHGYGNIVRLGAKFGTPVDGSLQFAGVGSDVSDLYFCYTDTQFGVRISKDGLLHVVKFDVTTAATGGTVTITLDSVPFVITLTAAGGNLSFTAHEIEIGGSGRTAYTGWYTEHVGNSVYFIQQSADVVAGTYSFTLGTETVATVSVSTQKTGAPLDTTFVPQSSWNGPSPMVSSLVPTRSNLYEIQYTWFGTANIVFRVYNPETGIFETVHTMMFANVDGGTYSVSAPNMFIQRGIKSISSTTALSMQSSGSFGATLGQFNLTKAARAAFSTEKSCAGGVATVVLVVSNRRQMNGYVNQSEILLRSVSITAEGNRIVRVRVFKNPVLSPIYTTSDYTSLAYYNETSSLAAFDTTTDTLNPTTGTILAEYVIPKDGGLTIDLSTSDIFIGSDEYIAFECFSVQINIVNISVDVISDN